MPKGSPRQMGGRPYFAAGYKFFMLFFMALTCLFSNAVQHAVVARSGEGLEIAQHLGRLAAERTERASEPDRQRYR